MLPAERSRPDIAFIPGAREVIELPEAGHASVRERPAFCIEQFARLVG